MRKKWVITLLLLITFCALSLIVYFSSQDGTKSIKASVSLTRYVGCILYPNGYTQEQGTRLHLAIRTIGHVGLYVFLGIVSGLWVQFSNRRKSVLFFIAAALCTIIGFADEWFKQYVPGRHFHLRDAFLNGATAIAALLLVCGVCRMFARRGQRKGKS